MKTTDIQYSTLSNIRITKSCWKELKKISVEKEEKIQETAADFLEKLMSEKINKDQPV